MVRRASRSTVGRPRVRIGTGGTADCGREHVIGPVILVRGRCSLLGPKRHEFGNWGARGDARAAVG